MERSTFEQHLNDATQRVLTFTRPLIREELPDQVVYLIVPHCSYDGNPLRFDEEVFPEDRLPEGQKSRPPANASEVVEFLWRGGKVPEWINIAVASADNDYTYILLMCCGRFSAEEGLYHRYQGVPPFNVQNPPLPPEWRQERNLVRRERFRQRNWELPMPTLEEMVAKHGKFPLTNILVELAKANRT